MSVWAEVCSWSSHDSCQHRNSFLKYPVNTGVISRLYGFVAERWREKKSLAERHRMMALSMIHVMWRILPVSKKTVYKEFSDCRQLSPILVSLPKFKCVGPSRPLGRTTSKSLGQILSYKASYQDTFWFWRRHQAFLGADSLP